jgi:hypothetical protein
MPLRCRRFRGPALWIRARCYRRCGGGGRRRNKMRTRTPIDLHCKNAGLVSWHVILVQRSFCQDRLGTKTARTNIGRNKVALLSLSFLRLSFFSFSLVRYAGYILVMMEAYETFGNATYLEEARTAADRLSTDRGADEFFMTYVRTTILVAIPFGLLTDGLIDGSLSG